MRQLIESLSYEGAIRPEGDPAPGGPDRCRLAGQDADARPVVYRWTAGRRFSFDRVRLGPQPVLRSASGEAATEATSPRLFLDEIGPALAADPERRRGFATELERTIVNDTQARRHCLPGDVACEAGAKRSSPNNAGRDASPRILTIMPLPPRLSRVAG